MFAFFGTVVDADKTFGSVRVRPSQYVVVDSTTGKIVSVSTSSPDPSIPIHNLPPDSFLMPGLIDAHIHAPQYAFAGIGTNRPLLDWLNEYTFPFESRCAEPSWANRVFNGVVRRSLRSGTTTAVYFATIHNPASLLLAEICRQRGQRAFVGKVSMDRNSPDFYVEESSDAALAAARAFVEKMETGGPAADPLVQPIVTPRFVPSCTSQTLSGLAALASEKDLLVQSHASENLSECDWVKSLHPEARDYTDAYAKHNLLTRKTLLAHVIHVTDEELDEYAKAGTTAVHCPLSNFTLTSGVCPVRRLMAHGVRVALGTDVSGGASASMFDAMRQAVIASQVAFIRAQEAEKKPEGGLPAPLGWKEVLYMATRAGAEALCLENKIGAIEPGFAFDALVVDPNAEDSPFDLFGWEKPEQVAEKFIMAGDDRNVTAVFVNGKCVSGKF